MSRHLTRGILASAVLSVVVAGVLIVIGVRIARPTIQAATLESLLGDTDAETCIASPATWGVATGTASLFAYDRHGHSANRNAPPIEPDLLRQALTTGQLAWRESPSRIVAVARQADDGPCALLRVSSGNSGAIAGPRLVAVWVLSIAGGMLLAAVGTLWLVVRPLRARIEALAVAARGVGTDMFSPQPPETDALGQIADVLGDSHERVVDTRRALERRNRALEDHLAGIAHDLRTPLSSMQLALEAMATESDGPMQQEARRALADVVYLSSLVENLHHATRLRHEVDVSSGTVDLGELVRRLEGRFTIVGRHANVAVAASVPDCAVRASCTPALAERAVANLIQNAIEHNPGPGHVAITLVVAPDGTRFELTVADDGPGLPPQALASLDNESFLVEGARQRGPGLGTLITAEVARRAGWSVTYEEREPRGLQVRMEGSVVP